MRDNSKNRSKTTLPSLQRAVRNFPRDAQHFGIEMRWETRTGFNLWQFRHTEKERDEHRRVYRRTVPFAAFSPAADAVRVR